MCQKTGKIGARGKSKQKLLTFTKNVLYNKHSQGERGLYHVSDLSTEEKTS